MDALDLVNLTPLMKRTSGSPNVRIGLIDGPVATQHTDLAGKHLREICGSSAATCSRTDSNACRHGTFVAGILCASRTSVAPAICPDCTLLLCPIFTETISGPDHMPSATPLELAVAILACVNARARIINLSLGLAQPSSRGEQALEEALDQAARHGVIVIAAAGNQGTLGSSAITRHAWVIPIIACDLHGRPMNESNLGNSIGRRGLSAPGVGITSLGPEEQAITFSGTSIAVPFVTGSTALLWSEFPTATAAQIKLGITQASTQRRTSVVPPLLDATAAYQALLSANIKR